MAMESYMLLLYVNLHQEKAIRQLFIEHRWKFVQLNRHSLEETDKFTPHESSFDIRDGKAVEGSDNDEIAVSNNEKEIPQVDPDINDDNDSVENDSILATDRESTVRTEDLFVDFETDKHFLSDIQERSNDDNVKESNVKNDNGIFFEKNTKKKQKTLANKTLKKRNLKKVTGKREYFCSDCKVTFRSLNRFNTHKTRNGTGKCVFTCEYCGKVFLHRKSNYDLHVRSVHLKERPHECDFCQKRFPTPDTLKIHMRVHTGEKPCVCEECGKRFISRGALSSHRSYNHLTKEEPADRTCNICHQTFSKQRYLEYHKKVTHSMQRDFHCQMCPKTFKTNSSLKRHLKYIHTELKQYQCDACDKAFKTLGSLKKHKERHDGKRTFICTECNRGFMEKSKLLQHYRTHTGEKPYQCDLCDHRCSIQGNLKKHMKIHNKEMNNSDQQTI